MSRRGRKTDVSEIYTVSIIRGTHRPDDRSCKHGVTSRKMVIFVSGKIDAPAVLSRDESLVLNWTGGCVTTGAVLVMMSKENNCACWESNPVFQDVATSVTELSRLIDLIRY
jgi:hypothetical protein